MTMSVKDQHDLTLGGTTYWLRTPTPYDMPRMRRLLTRQGIRRPAANELRVAALAGLMEMAEIADAAAEGERQRAVIERWYELMPPLDENDFDEPDQERRHAEMAGREAERRDERAALYADVMAIEANLERHFPPYAELIADLRYWDDVSRIDAVRLLLVRIGDDGHLPRDRDDLVDAGVYQALPEGDRVQLATFAFTLLTPSEASRKN